MALGRLQGPCGFSDAVVELGEEGRPTRWLDASTSVATCCRQGARVSGTAHPAWWLDGEGEEKKGKWASLQLYSG
jgi:hypothetical protein